MPIHRKPKPVVIPADEAQVGQLDTHIANWVAAGDAAKAWFASNPYFTQQAAQQKREAQTKAKADHLTKVGHKLIQDVGIDAVKAAKAAGKTDDEAMKASAQAQAAYAPISKKNQTDAIAAANAATSPTAEQLAVAAFQQHKGKFNAIKDTTTDELNAAGEVFDGLVK